MLEFKGQSEQCQPCHPLSEEALSMVTILDGRGGMLRDGLVKEDLI